MIKKICAYVGCSGYALPDSAYCETHQKTVKRNTTSKHAEWYHHPTWKKARKTFLLRMENIYCKRCLEKGLYTLADTVHHTLGYNSFSTFMDSSKWVAWCGSCHSSYHRTITNDELYEQNKNNW